MRLKYITFIAFVLICSALMKPSYGNDDIYGVQSAFIFRFLEYVNWPASKSKSQTICTYGMDPLDGFLEEMANEFKGKYNIRIKRHVSMIEVSECSMLYISKGDTSILPGLINKSIENSVLTVSEIPNFIELGGIIGFNIVDGKTYLNINYRQSQKAGLDVHAKLLGIAQKVIR